MRISHLVTYMVIPLCLTFNTSSSYAATSNGLPMPSLSNNWLFIFFFLSLWGVIYALYLRLKRLSKSNADLKKQLDNHHIRLDLAAEAGGLGLWDWDIKRNRFSCDERTYQLLDMDKTSKRSFKRQWIKIIHPDDFPRVETELNLALQGDKTFDSEFRINKADNTVTTVHCTAVKQHDSVTGSVTMSGIIWDVTKQKQLEEDNRKLATLDTLTNAKNRKGFIPMARTEFTRAKRYHGMFAVLMIDINNFKQLNNQHGQAMGDLALISLSNICISELRGSDVFCRLGADEFIALLHDNNLEKANIVIQRLDKAIRQLEIINQGDTITFSVSYGLAEYTPNDSSIEEVLIRADKALLDAKSAR